MCNLYHAAPKGDAERYIGRQLGAWHSEPLVGPFGEGSFLRLDPSGEWESLTGQWGMIRPGQAERIEHLPSKLPGRRGRPRSTNNARLEGIERKPTFRAAWAAAQRCLVPASWYQEPNWETGRNIWWQLRRQDGLPWMLAGLWSAWTDPATGEWVPNYTLITVNCDSHPLLNRLHKPDPELPPEAQDKRSLVHVAPEHWADWLQVSETQARALLTPPPLELFDLGDARRTDALLTQAPGLF